MPAAMMCWRRVSRAARSIGDQVRAILSDFKHADMQPRTEILLFQASRAQLVETVIRPHLAGGGVVVSDRYADFDRSLPGLRLPGGGAGADARR